MTALEVQELITKFGGPMSVVHFSKAGPADPTKPWIKGDVTESVVNTRGVFLQAKHIKYGLRVDQQKDQNNVTAEEERILVGAYDLSTPPTVDDVVRVGAENWKVVSAVPVHTDGVCLAYTLQVRR